MTTTLTAGHPSTYQSDVSDNSVRDAPASTPQRLRKVLKANATAGTPHFHPFWAWFGSPYGSDSLR